VHNVMGGGADTKGSIQMSSMHNTIKIAEYNIKG